MPGIFIRAGSSQHNEVREASVPTNGVRPGNPANRRLNVLPCEVPYSFRFSDNLCYKLATTEKHFQIMVVAGCKSGPGKGIETTNGTNHTNGNGKLRALNSYYYLFESCFLAQIFGSTDRKGLSPKGLCLAQRRQERQEDGRTGPQETQEDAKKTGKGPSGLLPLLRVFAFFAAMVFLVAAAGRAGAFV